MSATPRSTRIRALAALCAFGLLAVACGDDDDTEASTDDTEASADDTLAEGEAAAGADVEEYCAAVAEMDEAEGFDPALFERIREAAPEEISEEIDYVADAFIEAEGDTGAVFSDPKVEENFGPIEEFEAEHCDAGEDGDSGPDGEEEVATEPLDGAEIVEVTAVDFAFEGIPDSVPSGDVSFHMVNEGDAAHEMFMARLGEGVELDDVLAMEEEPSPDQAEEIGGTFAPPGESAYLNAEGLEPGTYAVVCFIPGPEGKAHHELGMKTTFTVS